MADDRALRWISPLDVLGEPSRGQPAPVGCGIYFPSLQAHWKNNRPLLDRVMEQHDVSKHREMIFQGGQMRNDPPVGFFEGLGIPEGDPRRVLFQPWAEVLIHPAPKSPRAGRQPVPVADQIHLEPLAQEYCDFMNESARRSLADAQKTIVLKQTSFLQGAS